MGVQEVVSIANSNSGGFVLCLLALLYLNRKLRKCEKTHEECKAQNTAVERRCMQLEVQLIRLNPKVESLETALGKLKIGEFTFIK